MKKNFLRVATMAVAASAALALTAAPAFAAGSPAAPVLDTKALDAAIQIHNGENAAAQIGLVAAPGETWRGAAGDQVSRRAVDPNSHFRIGSVSKVFEATVLLQLAAQHRVDLDKSVQSYLPGVLPKKTFAPITVRQLLNHTSGLPIVDEGVPPSTPDQVISGRFKYQTFEQIVHDTLHPQGRPAPGPHFAPGTKQEYNSFNYRVAGLLIERITHHSFKAEVTSRVLKPAGMTQTSVPERDRRLPSPYLHGYYLNSHNKEVDVSEAEGDPSSMISTPGDLDKFIVALFSGKLLPAAQQTELFALPRNPQGALLCDPATSPAGSTCFSTGLMANTLPGGLILWGKTGHDLGYASGMFATRDLQRHGVYAVGLLKDDGGAAPAVTTRLAAAMFSKPGSN